MFSQKIALFSFHILFFLPVTSMEKPIVSLMSMPYDFHYAVALRCPIKAMGRMQQTCSRFAEEYSPEKLFLNRTFCLSLNSNEHRNAMVYYAQTNNKPTLTALVKYENEINKYNRFNLLRSLNYPCADSLATAVSQVVQAYKGIAHEETELNSDHMLTASSAGEYEKIYILLKNNADINITNSMNVTSIMFAIIDRNTQIIELLIKAGCDVDKANTHQLTPLHYLCNNSMPQILELLLQRTHNVNPQNSHGKTPLHLAIQRQDIKCAKLLLFYDADITIQDNHGNTPFDYITNPEIKAKLKQIVQQLQQEKKLLKTTNHKRKQKSYLENPHKKRKK